MQQRHLRHCFPGENVCRQTGLALRRSSFEVCFATIPTDFHNFIVSNFRESFIDPETNSTYLEGQYVKRERLAKTLEIIAVEGAHALYSVNGSLIQGFVQDVQDNGGILTVDDLLEYE